ncbi:DUF2141 domain-containing protein [Psychroflexus sp. CAK57W]|uniref:DUF2141 domain-containing protein n=1 Tax=Psychroflexus curvus TaxID=2873595 RepID=UPI001CCD60F5|nr:DUF2141 domain-containing protein [Psychroflexus curvus]MBZ9629066.1 DUF2141 domain-containing protein [Psychroflexus curvus]MBZ9787422.1 DUF2141 domain-containing protein [Psychroflexus curvus]
MKTIVFTVLVSMASFTGFSQDLSLKVSIQDIEKSEGVIYLSLHDNENSFPSGDKDALQTGKIENFDSKAEFRFTGLAQGEYAVSVFQDLNGNAELDTNFLGIPKEPVGASKMTSFGRPKFAKCKFLLSEDSTIRIEFMN